MRTLLFLLLALLYYRASAQHDELAYRHNYAFIADSSALVPLQGTYRVEYLARGQWWSYMPPRTPVNYAGQQKVLKPGIKVNGTPLMVVEMERDHMTTDNKLRVVRGADTMIVDISPYGKMEGRMLARTANMAVPPRPPVLLPFRVGWFTCTDLVEEARTIANTERFDALWKTHRTAVLALYDTARYMFTLETNGLEIGPPQITIARDPNYARHMLQFPASGPGTWFELYRQDSLGVPTTPMALRVDMPPDGETGQWVDITDLPSARYSAFLKWGAVQSLFYITFG